MTGYTEHVTRVIPEDVQHPQLGTVAVLRIAPPEGEERRPATLGPASVDALETALREALRRAEDGQIQALTLTGTDRVFLAGADLSMFADPAVIEQIRPLTRRMHALQRDLRSCPVPVLAHLNGAALGGGLEVALMADVRTAAPGVRGIGVPETSLGILPGWGGTTLLPGVVGGETAVRLILEDPARDRQLSSSQALELGLVDAVVDSLEAALDHLAQRAIDPSARPNAVPAADSEQAQQLRAALDAPHGAETRRAWAERLAAAGAPAVERALHLLEQLPGSDLEAALSREEDALVELAQTPAAAASLYAAELLRRGKPGRTPVVGARELRRIGVAGAGLMASQIAATLALGLQVPVVLRDLDQEIADRGLAHARDVIAQAAARGALREDQAQQVAGLLSATARVEDLADCDLVLEAVPEILGVKQKVFAELEQHVAADALLVTNTSSLSVTAMGEGLQHPERLIGLHFFNPVAKMPLVEVIHTDTTDETTLATGLEVVRACRKFVVQCADAPGFVVNRLLFRVLGEVLRSLDAGADPAAVDASLDELGLPMRPFTLLDLVGLGVADHVGRVLGEELGERFWVSPGLAAMTEQGERFSQPTRDAVHAPVNPRVAEVFAAAQESGAPTRGVAVGSDLLQRVQDGLAEEIRMLLEEHVVEDPGQVDLAMILGAGYPRHRGGITPYLDQVGASQRATGRTFHGERFTG
ncbi:enoyl-CoA hydratase/isomerase family protein [Brachybacterium sp. EF45031]|uniref:3-hydroxyacyl-CoA dehydrogenase NAD-binding domain-containing protein n=1 Tax=Brachybacterium sillae TaxID=2810536 RepID=UPI00217DB50D|nr:3-hydroxyacyl-CoA dehydrogenase NAD-binding domain-containing protein [Brachybacterium sillae]MCS6711743.1 enoyl-CoA hydratase/isomerase family protein [Brachybacterium sillae]